MKWTKINIAYLLAILALMTGCAGTTYSSINSEKADQANSGIRYYDTSPFLFIHTDNEGGLVSELVYLPDPSKKRSAKPFAILAKNKSVLTWNTSGSALTGANSEADSGDVPKAVVAALEEAGKAAIKFAAFDTGEATATKPEAPLRAPAAYLFKVVKKRIGEKNGEWGLVGASTSSPEYSPSTN